MSHFRHKPDDFGQIALPGKDYSPERYKLVSLTYLRTKRHAAHHKEISQFPAVSSSQEIRSNRCHWRFCTSTRPLREAEVTLVLCVWNVWGKTDAEDADNSPEGSASSSYKHNRNRPRPGTRTDHIACLTPTIQAGKRVVESNAYIPSPITSAREISSTERTKHG